VTKLSILETEARRVLGRRLRRGVQALQESLVGLCQEHWPEIRGPQPQTTLARAVWEIRPPLAELFVHLYAAQDPRLATALDRLTPAQALGLLVLSELEHGDAEGARTAHEAMMLFESQAGRDAHTRAVVAKLGAYGRGFASRLIHARRPPLWRAVAAVAAHIARHDSPALREAARVLAQAQAAPAGLSGDHELGPLLQTLRSLSVVFRGLDGTRLLYSVRGEEQGALTAKRLADMLAQIQEEEQRSSAAPGALGPGDATLKVTGD